MEDRTRDFSRGDLVYYEADYWFEYHLDQLIKSPENYQYPRWHEQEEYVEVWCEKEALASLFLQVTRPLKVICGICRGYPSIGWLRDAAIRIQTTIYRPDYEFQRATVLYFGDFDPSGKDIERNITERLQNTFRTPVTVKRIAITPAQIKKYNIPPMPTKKSDSRSKDHIAKYGINSSVELDAIEPDVLQDIIRDAIEERFDGSIPDEYKDELEGKREQIREWVEAVTDKKGLAELYEQEDNE
jgi:hypothetical protein